MRHAGSIAEVGFDLPGRTHAALDCQVKSGLAGTLGASVVLEDALHTDHRIAPADLVEIEIAGPELSAPCSGRVEGIGRLAIEFQQQFAPYDSVILFVGGGGRVLRCKILLTPDREHQEQEI